MCCAKRGAIELIYAVVNDLRVIIAILAYRMCVVNCKASEFVVHARHHPCSPGFQAMIYSQLNKNTYDLWLV